MKSKNPYTFFDQFCLRTPLLPLDFYHNLTAKERITTDDFKEIWSDKVIREAVFLASPELFEAIEKWLDNRLTNAGKIQRLQSALLKYLSRMSSRCTPFGLFAGCSVGSFGDATNITLAPCTENNRQTRFDMNFLVAFSQQLSKEDHIKNQLLWYPNTSLYKIGKQYRYVEYTYNEHNKRMHSIEAVTYTPYLETIIKNARSGRKIRELAPLLVNDDIVEEEGVAFIEKLIAHQILVSELEPSVTGEDFLVQLQKGLRKLKGTTAIVAEIDRFREFMDETDRQLGNAAQRYIDFSVALEKSKTPFDLKYLFQADMYTQTLANTLNVRWAYKIKRAMTLLNKISPPRQNTNLEQFKNAFIKRYETREIPLAAALDTEIGIGYLQDRGAIDSTPFLDDLDVPALSNPQQSLPWNPVQEMLYKKLQEVLKNNASTLSLEDRDLEQSEVKWDDLPDTMSTMVALVHVDGEEKMKLSQIGGSSAANLLGRFSTGNPEMLKHVQHIIATEKQMHPDTLMAEIVHLPESRTGNVIRRSGLRDYEIPYLGKSNLPPEQQLPLDDLMISVKRNSLVLRSKKHNKEVLPRLTNAHNYSVNALPVYHFLCDLQLQNRRSGMRFHWGHLQEKHTFLPRVIYKDFILSAARWKISKEDIATLRNKQEKSEAIIAKVADWRAERQIPKLVQLIDSDNTLLINLEHPDLVAMWLETVKNRGYFILEEFLFAGESTVKQNGQQYTNQFVISFYNKERWHNAKHPNTLPL